MSIAHEACAKHRRHRYGLEQTSAPRGGRTSAQPNVSGLCIGDGDRQGAGIGCCGGGGAASATRHYQSTPAASRLCSISAFVSRSTGRQRAIAASRLSSVEGQTVLMHPSTIPRQSTGNAMLLRCL